MSESSPCSVPEWLRLVVPIETPRQQSACRRHDERYERGGDRRARLVADLVFGLDLLGAAPEMLAIVTEELARGPLDGAMDADRTEKYVLAVRQWGGLHWNGGDRAGGVLDMRPDIIEAP